VGNPGLSPLPSLSFSKRAIFSFFSLLATYPFIFLWATCTLFLFLFWQLAFSLFLKEKRQ